MAQALAHSWLMGRSKKQKLIMAERISRLRERGMLVVADGAFADPHSLAWETAAVMLLEQETDEELGLSERIPGSNDRYDG